MNSYNLNTDLTPTSLSQFNAKNQWQRNSLGDTYDASGNQTGVGSYSAPTVSKDLFTFDAESRMITSSVAGMGTTSYLYDGNGRRAEKISNGVGTVYVYDAAGDLAEEYTTAATTGGTVGTDYFTADALGSTRLLTGTVTRRYDYLPFGDELPAGTGVRTTAQGYGSAVYPMNPPDVVSQKFTGKERDAETGLDYFGARYFSGAEGRFISADWATKPEAVPYANLEDPQTLNLYGYVRNNPLKSTDPTGHCPICLAEEFFASPEGQAITEEGSALLQKAVAVGLVLGAATLDNARPPSYVPGGSLTDEKGNSIFSSNVRSENSNSDQSSNQPQSSLVGNNPREAKGRVNTDLPGGHDEAKATFGKQTEGQQVKTDSATGHQVSEDGTRLRLNPDGTARVDIPASATRPKHETVHFNPPQKNTPGQP